MLKENVRCKPGEDVFHAAEQKWGKQAVVEICYKNGKIFLHNSPDKIYGRTVIGMVTVRPYESFYVTSSGE